MMCVREHLDEKADTGVSKNKQNLYILFNKKRESNFHVNIDNLFNKILSFVIFLPVSLNAGAI